MDDRVQLLAEGRFVRLVRRGNWEWAERTNTREAVVIVAVTGDRRLVLVEQYRVPLDVGVIELPAGLSGDEPGTQHEGLLEAARRELLEETGYESSRWSELVEGPSSAGLTTETYTMFLAQNATKTGPGGGDHSEDIEVYAVPLDQVETWLDAKRRHGVAVDPRIYAGVYFAAKL
jgi:ADP-ribose pyrophosphatase